MAILVTGTGVHCDDRSHAFYREIVSPNLESSIEIPFATMYQAFFTFACIGKYHDTFVPLTKKQEIFKATYFDRERQVPILVSLAYSRLFSQGLDAVEAFAQVTTNNGFVPIVEGWANGGVGIFQEELRKRGNPSPTKALSDLVMLEAKKWL
jgi:hypothetical protein